MIRWRLDLVLWLDDAASRHCRAARDLLRSVRRTCRASRGRRDAVVTRTCSAHSRSRQARKRLAWATMFERTTRSALHRARHRRRCTTIAAGKWRDRGNFAADRSHDETSLRSLDSHDWRRPRATASSAPRRAISACDFVFACAMIAQHLSRWAEQWIIYMTTEFGFIKIADRYTTSSR